MKDSRNRSVKADDAVIVTMLESLLHLRERECTIVFIEGDAPAISALFPSASKIPDDALAEVGT